MKVEFVELTSDEVQKRLRGKDHLELHVDVGGDWYPNLIYSVEPQAPTPFRSRVFFWNRVAEKRLVFGDCPSKHGWHNPEGLTPEKVLEEARRVWGNDVEPSTVRLLTRDEIGTRLNATSLIRLARDNGILIKWSGNMPDKTYMTRTPYGKLPEIEKYTFPETAPYGYSRTTGKRIDPGPGWVLLPLGTELEGRRLLFFFVDNSQDKGGTEINCLSYRRVARHDRDDAVFEKDNNMVKPEKPTRVEYRPWIEMESRWDLIRVQNMLARVTPAEEAKEAKRAALAFYTRLYELAEELQPGKIPGGEYVVWWAAGSRLWQVSGGGKGESDALFHTRQAAERAAAVMNEEGWRLPAGIGQETTED